MQTQPMKTLNDTFDSLYRLYIGCMYNIVYTLLRVSGYYRIPLTFLLNIMLKLDFKTFYLFLHSSYGRVLTVVCVYSRQHL